MDISKASPKGLKESLDELRDDLEEDVLEATDAGLPATGAGSALRQPAAPAIKGKTAAAPSSTASKLLGGRKTGEGSQELLEDGNTGLFGAAFGSQGSGSKSGELHCLDDVQQHPPLQVRANDGSNLCLAT